MYFNQLLNCLIKFLAIVTFNSYFLFFFVLVNISIMKQLFLYKIQKLEMVF